MYNKTKRLTVAQATIRFLKQQYVERDGREHKFFAGCFGIFGHGNVGGIGEALQENPDFRYYQTRNEQAMVHTAAAFAKVKNRLSTFACTSSIGPGATNMITGAAAATINRLPVLLLPGDIFARRNVAPVLQQLEMPCTQDIGVNDCFKPVSRYWDRINRAEQLITSLPEVMRVLTSPGDTGTVTLALPQDVQAEAFDFPVELFEKRIWTIPRIRPDATILARAAEWMKQSKKPMIIAGGGVIYSDATEILKQLVEKTGIPVAETFAGKGSLRFDQKENLGAIGVTGTPGANAIAAESDLVIGIGTRYTDFTTCSKTGFQNPKVRFININVAEFDAFKHSALPAVGDAKVTLCELLELLGHFKVETAYQERVAQLNREWDKVVTKTYHLGHGVPVSQGEVVGAVNDFVEPSDILLCAAGSLPGDLHKLWRTRDPKGFHLEYGYSTMGYEIAGGLGAKMAAPDREVYIMVGDGNYLMMNHEIVTSVQEGYKLNIILLNNHGFASIGGLSESLGGQRFGTQYRFRDEKSGQIAGDRLPVNFAENARSLGAHAIECTDIASLKEALTEMKKQSKTTVITIETDLFHNVPGYAWWEVGTSEVAEIPSVKKAYKAYVKNKEKQRYFL
ncbi:3D-(3,5/4)-trihydroxycyclohexane-1,2-dione acylhydrolase (decyclizing) [candidate division KSB1 bacterium]|nr:3D-(3,5/4)-trihydroxycyclohexane-1,2-dione acylhydrolase (decyclizing) [candidate division KSB1 bacterium]